jgi:hypothetical protein
MLMVFYAMYTNTELCTKHLDSCRDSAWLILEEILEASFRDVSSACTFCEALTALALVGIVAVQDSQFELKHKV